MWSMGCIYAELLQASQSHKDLDYEDSEKFLFPGKCCHPMSPCKEFLEAENKNQNLVSPGDMIFKIMEYQRPLD